MTEEIKSNGNGIDEEQKPQTDFKVCEIWIKSGQIYLEGSGEFWSDRIRALGVLEMCKDIIKTAEMPKEEKRIITNSRLSPIDFVKSKLKRKK